nr:prepilin-type N-terminal cleavage/methylation domain-containing protein [Maliibacterium massiliense]
MNRMRLRKGRRGFTLVELMLALALFALVAVVLMSVYTAGVQNATRDMTAANDREQLRGAMSHIQSQVRQQRVWVEANPGSLRIKREMTVYAYTLKGNRLYFNEDATGQEGVLATGIRAFSPTLAGDTLRVVITSENGESLETTFTLR